MDNFTVSINSVEDFLNDFPIHKEVVDQVTGRPTFRRLNTKDLPEETPNYIPYKNLLINGIISILVIIQLQSSLSSGGLDLLSGKEITKINKNDTVQFAVLSSLSSIPLPPVHINSSWIGNQWVPPPGYMIYSANEIQNYFHQQSILIVGDSTARQLYSTLYGILNATENPDNMNDVDSRAGRIINRSQDPKFCQKEGYQVCRKMPTSTSSNQSSTSRHNYDLFYGA
jgi:hypothetical protein